MTAEFPMFESIMADVDEALDIDPETSSLSPEVRRETIARAMTSYSPTRSAPLRASPSVIADDPPEPSWLHEQERVYVIPEAGDRYWYEPPEDAQFFDHYVLSRRKLGRRVPGGLLITGQAGIGKTLGVVQGVARINADHGLSIPLLVMDCPTLTDPQKWFGRREVDGKGTRYETSDFVYAVEHGYVILFDEFMRLHPTIVNPIMSLFAGLEAVTLSDLNLTITRHPETVFVGTTNQGAQFGGTHRMDWAMRERWSFTIERDYPPAAEEVRILTSHNPGCDQDAATVLVDIGRESRRLWQKGDLRSPISTRTLDNAAFLVASGYTEREALERTAIPEYDGTAEGTTGTETDRDRIKSLIQGRTG